ncbi:hydroxylysine kinase [Zophobas morio]|uniref:hydroxylysine kinase n=1 Tax=Zophobas morio TaxID=2755281 RepID=UPI003082E34E
MASKDYTVLKPGVSIKPVVSHNEINIILSEVYGLKCTSLKELNGYDDNNYHVKVEESWDNSHIQKINTSGYTLKIVNSLDSEKPQFFEAQNELLVYLGKTGICCPTPVQNKTGHYYIIKQFSSGKHIVRLLEFIDGSILHQVPSSTNLFYESGKYVASLDEALQNFHHPAYDNHKTVWHLESVPQLSQFLYAVSDTNRKKIVEEVIEEFSKRVLPMGPNMKRGMIHGDFNEQNILVEEKDGVWCIKGVLDFGDSHLACYIYELAVTMTYMMIQGKSLDVGGHVLAGYSSVREIPLEEFKLLKVCIAGRLCQSLVLGAYSSLQDPDNSYILVTSKPGWALLEEMWVQPENALLERWKNIVESYKAT